MPRDGSMSGAPPAGQAGDGRTTAAVILATGQASRMGRPKALIDFGGVPLVRHVADRAIEAGFGRVTVVVAEPVSRFEVALADLPVTLRLNQRAREGIATSIAAGLDSLDRDVGWLALLLADQPFVPAAHLSEMRGRARAPHVIVASRYDGTVGVPAMFAREVFPRLAALTADQGCKAVIRAFAEQTLLLDCPDAAIDIDTPDDHARARGRYCSM